MMELKVSSAEFKSINRYDPKSNRSENLSKKFLVSNTLQSGAMIHVLLVTSLCDTQVEIEEQGQSKKL